MKDHDLFRAGCWHDLDFDDGVTAKFWSIKIHKDTHIRKWGAAGTDGRGKTIQFDNAEAARKDARRLFNSKIKEGYKVSKPNLEVKTELAHFVDYGDFESFINRVYGIEDWSFVADQECGNDSSHRFCPDGELSEYDKGDIKDWVDSDGADGCYMAHRLLDDCVRQRLIPAGVYIVEVCW